MMRSTYGAYLADWANIDSGQISGDAQNQGAAAWLYQSEKGPNNYSHIPIIDGWWAWSGEADLGFWGGLRAASVNVVEDRVVGLYAFGGEVTLTGDVYALTPKDGVRTRFTLHNRDRFAVQLDKATYTRAEVRSDLRSVSLTLQNPASGTYAPEITLRRLPAGSYGVTVNGGAEVARIASDGTVATVRLTDLSGSGHVVRVA